MNAGLSGERFPDGPFLMPVQRGSVSFYYFVAVKSCHAADKDGSVEQGKKEDNLFDENRLSSWSSPTRRIYGRLAGTTFYPGCVDARLEGCGKYRL